MTQESSTGLPSRLASTLAYAGWWVTGALFWWIERRDAEVRFHAAQSLVTFGLAAVAILLFGGMAVLSLQLLPAAFMLFLWAAGLTALAALVLWVVVVSHAIQGRRWKVPALGALAERLV